MSLFGSSPPASTPANSKGIFGDEPSAAASSSSLFAEESTDSPWSMPTPKKAARQNMIKTLLPGTDVPESYVDAFDAVLNAKDKTGVGISLTGLKKILQSSNLNSDSQSRIINLVVPGGQESVNGLGRSEFNVLLALIGLGQEGEDVTLDGVDERRKNLPQPKISYIDQLHTTAELPKEPSAPAPKSSPRREPKLRQDSFGGDPTADPWASPANKSIPPPSTAAHTVNGIPQSAQKTMANERSRNTSAYTSATGQDGAEDDSPPNSRTPGPADNAWTGFSGSSGGFSDQPTLSGGFGDSGDNRSNPPAHQPSQSVSGSVRIAPGTGESVIVTLLPDKEGMFMFQHHNYEVKTVRKGTSVVRRYSDFVWLLDCLHKRYPFRRLPLLPPKRVQLNGTHLAGDVAGFLEKRRKGLARFANQLVQHPILNQEQLVQMFLSVPTYQELSVWRKQATISVQEEFTGKSLPPNLEDSLPVTLPALFEQVRAGVKQSTEIYINLCVLLERLVRRTEGVAADNLKLSLAFQSLTESTAETYAVDTNDVPLLNEGINAAAKHYSSSQTLLEDESRAWEAHTLEDLKTIRDAMVSMRDVFDRRDRYAKDNIPQIEKRIEASETKLQQLRSKPAEQVKAGQIEKVESSIISDKESIVQQHARGVFIKECVRDEIVTFQSSIHAISKFQQDWAQERVKYAELQASNWKALVDGIESMPTGD